jgi:hypothetical protein
MATIITILHSWRMKDPRSGRWRQLKFKLSDDDARKWIEKEGVELEKIASTEERRHGSEGYSAN